MENVVIIIESITGFCIFCGVARTLWRRISSKPGWEEYQCSECKIIRQIKVK